MDSAPSLQEAIATLSPAVRAWLMWLNIIVVGAVATFLIYRETRWIGVALASLTAAMVVAMHMLYAQIGFVRLLGAPHLIFWGPFAIWLVLRLRQGGVRRIPAVVAWVLLASLAVSLAFDAIDVARWVSGERASMLPPR